jgi:hypothetical protein
MLGAMDEDDFKKKVANKQYERPGPHGRVLGLDMGLKGRQIERRRRCGNCQWYDMGEAFEAHYHNCTMRDGRLLRDRGATHRVVEAQANKMREVILDNRDKGDVGYCTKRLIRKDDQAADDFTSAGYLCDQWTGQYGLRFGPEEGPIDKLPDEIVDDFGETQPPRPDEEEPARPDEEEPA